MASYFTLILDTTAPLVEIYTPAYELVTNEINVWVRSSEVLGPIRNIYTIDNKGVRRDYTFIQTAVNELFGSFSLRDYALGIATIYAELSDEVGNISVASKSFLVIDYVALKTSVAIKVLQPELIGKMALVDLKNMVITPQLVKKVCRAELDYRTRKVELDYKESAGGL